MDDWLAPEQFLYPRLAKAQLLHERITSRSDDARRRIFREAHRNGLSCESIAAATGLPRQAIEQIVTAEE
jgi:hypothetical protein